MTGQFEDFVGMGSKPAHERALAEHQRLLANPAPRVEPDVERRLVRASMQGDLAAAHEQLGARAWADLEQESQRLARNAPAIQAEIAAVRQANHEKDLRRRRLAAQQPPDRVSLSEGGLTTTVAGGGPWERLAARAHAEAARRTVGGPLPSQYDPDQDDVSPGDRVVARLGE